MRKKDRKNKLSFVSNIILGFSIFLMLGVWLGAFAVDGFYTGFEYYFFAFLLFTIGIVLKAVSVKS
ncbi:hypothetical protein [Acidianus sp. HS-5]|uniref:hypothetical protein n=1 Tax=Acidianus sp. HS-5 TaxID=2886040 RepID=UPI001F37EDC7|nr:hypothetical protein [Acidianus sp. HS-5]